MICNNNLRLLMSDLYKFDLEYINQGVKKLCGIDEVGRGPLAGPVYAVAFLFNENEINGVNDSKKLTPKKRELLFQEIEKNNLKYGLGISSVEEIDNINILNATKLAMKRALSNLKIIPDLVLVDGNFSPDFGVKSIPIVKGDSKSYSISCASIIAKVLRDKFMTDIDEKFPNYGFKQNKGYGTKFHIESIKKFGPCEIHRKLFLGKIL